MKLLALALAAALLPACLASVPANSTTQGAASAADRNETSFDGKCTIIGQNVAITTPDIHFFPSKFSVDTCCDLCTDYPGCGAFTLNASGCALKGVGEHPPVRVATGVTSGVNPNVKPGDCTGSSSGLNAVSCAAWQVFAKATNITGWAKCSGALLDPCSCNWPYGSVTCAGGDITEIDIDRNDLEGTIPSSLGSLTKLTRMSLAGNRNFEGTIPSSLGSLTELTYMDLSGDKLKGTIPSSLASLTELTHLILLYNALTGLVPPLPFKQYGLAGCGLDHPGCTAPPGCNLFKCPLPAGSEQCRYGSGAGVHCK
jgi:hypothetical protein